MPDGTLVSEEMSLYPTEMNIKAYSLSLRYERDLTKTGEIYVIEAGGASQFLTSCSAVGNAKSEACGSQYEMTPRLTCEW